jgi:hypothetical protein
MMRKRLRTIADVTVTKRAVSPESEGGTFACVSIRASSPLFEEPTAEGVLEDLQHKLCEDHLKADRDSPRVDDQAELCHFSESVPVGLLAHFTIGTDFEFDYQS